MMLIRLHDTMSDFDNLRLDVRESRTVMEHHSYNLLFASLILGFTLVVSVICLGFLCIHLTIPWGISFVFAILIIIATATTVGLSCRMMKGFGVVNHDGNNKILASQRQNSIAMISVISTLAILSAAITPSLMADTSHRQQLVLQSAAIPATLLVYLSLVAFGSRKLAGLLFSDSSQSDQVHNHMQRLLQSLLAWIVAVLLILAATKFLQMQVAEVIKWPQPIYAVFSVIQIVVCAIIDHRINRGWCFSWQTFFKEELTFTEAICNAAQVCVWIGVYIICSCLMAALFTYAMAYL